MFLLIFDGLNVTTATWKPLTVGLLKQATPWYRFIWYALVAYRGRYTGKSMAFQIHRVYGRNLALDGSFQVMTLQVFLEK
jgi:hypothetical protein